MNGDTQIIFSHPEALFSKGGRELMKTQVFKRNVVANAWLTEHIVSKYGKM